MCMVIPAYKIDLDPFFKHWTTLATFLDWCLGTLNCYDWQKCVHAPSLKSLWI